MRSGEVALNCPEFRVKGFRVQGLGVRVHTTIQIPPLDEGDLKIIKARQVGA